MEMWLARDKDGYLFLYEYKPIIDEDNPGSFTPSELSGCMRIDDNMFPEVIFEKSPQKVELL